MGKFNREYTNQVYNCNSKDGKTLTGEDEILKRWKEHFQQMSELIQMPDESSTNISQEISLEGNNEITEEPTYEEVMEIISSLKNNKSPRSDNIVNELIKEGGHSLWTRIYKLILKIWKTEQMPNEWKEGIICPIFKTGNKDCNN